MTTTRHADATCRRLGLFFLLSPRPGLSRENAPTGSSSAGHRRILIQDLNDPRRERGPPAPPPPRHARSPRPSRSAPHGRVEEVGLIKAELLPLRVIHFRGNTDVMSAKLMSGLVQSGWTHLCFHDTGESSGNTRLQQGTKGRPFLIKIIIKQHPCSAVYKRSQLMRLTDIFGGRRETTSCVTEMSECLGNMRQSFL